MCEKVSYLRYGKLEGKIISIRKSYFTSLRKLSKYYLDIEIAKMDSNNNLISICIKRRKKRCKGLKVGDFVSFET